MSLAKMLRPVGHASLGEHAAAPIRTPLDRVGLLKRGGGEIRTPVLHKIFRDFYVRSPPIDVSGRWLVGNPRQDEPSMVSRYDGRRTAALARICVT